MATGPRYDQIGDGYARFRREDPAIRAAILRALGPAETVVNVGAGTGSYEPDDRQVIPIEPSAVMAAQRPADLAPAIRASAARLPLEDQSVDAAMALLTVHHWDEELEDGLRELRRVSRGPVVILTYDPRISCRMWLIADYLPEVGELDRHIFPAPEWIAELLGGETETLKLPIHRDTPDWMLGSYWAHPERVLDPAARAATSGFARMAPSVVRRVVRNVDDDLRTGAWDTRYGHLRLLDSLDVGLRLLINHPRSARPRAGRR